MKKVKANIMVDATGQQKLTISEGCVIRSITPKGGKVLLLEVSRS